MLIRVHKKNRYLQGAVEYVNENEEDDKMIATIHQSSERMLFVL